VDGVDDGNSKLGQEEFVNSFKKDLPRAKRFSSRNCSRTSRGDNGVIRVYPFLGFRLNLVICVRTESSYRIVSYQYTLQSMDGNTTNQVDIASLPFGLELRDIQIA
jgi:hypothetical protein